MSDIALQFMNWVKPRGTGDGRYNLYWEILSQQPSTFWRDVGVSAAGLDERRQSLAHYLVMGAVQYLVLENPAEPLAAFFPATGRLPSGSQRELAGTLFSDFYQRRESEIWRLVETRDVHINKLGRLSVFAPFFLHLAQMSRERLAFIDVGCSVGLGLLWQHFSYFYPGHGSIRVPGRVARRDLTCEVFAQPLLPLKGELPQAATLCGIDTSPLSATSPEDRQWLLALTAPGDAAGRESLAAGLQVAAEEKPHIEHGCVLDVLPRIAAGWASDQPLVVYHSMTMHHLRAEGKEARFHEMLKGLSATRAVWEVSIEWESSTPQGRPRRVEAALRDWCRGAGEIAVMAETDPSADGRYIRFA